MEEKLNEKNSTSNKNDELSKRLWIIFKFIIGVILLLLSVYKILSNQITLKVENIDYTLLLSFLLAFFSMILSMMFYFKSNDSSNKFYDNTYKFTKDISIILGRIESGFGEKLQNLDKGYSGLLNKIDTSPINTKDIENTKTDKKEVEQTLQSEIKERNKIIENLIEKTQLDQMEKEEIQKSLFGKEKTILRLEKELRILQMKLERQRNEIIIENIPDRLISFFRRYLLRLNINSSDFNREKAQDFINQFIPENEERKINDKLYIDLLENRLIRENGLLTNRGYSIIRNALTEIQ
ncbi:hypothetical protein [Elizabethkingia anophelis]|uniref:hypothetical protein n=1 Tax=Elizabethkingia anophelis TaxID=1117645 RepID=UPI0038923067